MGAPWLGHRRGATGLQPRYLITVGALISTLFPKAALSSRVTCRAFGTGNCCPVTLARFTFESHGLCPWFMVTNAAQRTCRAALAHPWWQVVHTLDVHARCCNVQMLGFGMRRAGPQDVVGGHTRRFPPSTTPSPPSLRRRAACFVGQDAEDIIINARVWAGRLHRGGA